MELRDIVAKLLKDQNRSLSWLATEMNKTFDGLKLSLVKGSLKYTDIKLMAAILKVPASSFFYEAGSSESLGEEYPVYRSLRSELGACKELVDVLKSQLDDKEKIIRLLSEEK